MKQLLSILLPSMLLLLPVPVADGYGIICFTDAPLCDSNACPEARTSVKEACTKALERDCLEEGAWGVTGQVGDGDGSALFWVSCGDVTIADCIASGTPCNEGPNPSRAGNIGCFWRVYVAPVRSASGTCYDPIMPETVLMALPEGATTDLNLHALHPIGVGNIWAPAGGSLP